MIVGFVFAYHKRMLNTRYFGMIHMGIDGAIYLTRGLTPMCLLYMYASLT
jgi:hypothetical protein